MRCDARLFEFGGVLFVLLVGEHSSVGCSFFSVPSEELTRFNCSKIIDQIIERKIASTNKILFSY